MKIITWNCNMAFRKKADFILAHKPDILIIPECEHPDKLLFKEGILKPTDTLWFGKNQHKGLAIFSYCALKFKVLDIHNDTFKMIIPIAVTSENFEFNLFAVWANNPEDKDGHYVTQVWKAINHYDSFITKKRTILIGDFNSNTIWDKPRRDGNHSTVVEHLERKNIYSVYHQHFSQVQGAEKHPTFYLHRNKAKPYHIDYCFASKDMIKHLESVEIGDFDFWSKHSDHAPVIVNFDGLLLNNNLHNMPADNNIEIFLSSYSETVYNNSITLRKIILSNLPNVIEQIDIPAKMIAYCYGQKYSEMVCTIIPSKKGVKLGFYKGADLPDPHKLLEGKGKISRYVEIKSEEQINPAAIKQLIKDAFAAYKQRRN